MERPTSPWIPALLCSLLLLLIFGSSMMGLRNQMLARANQEEAEQRGKLQKLTTRLDLLESQANALMAQPQQSAELETMKTTLTTTADHVDALDQRLTALETKPVVAAAPPPPAKVEAKPPVIDTLTPLKEAVMRGAPYSEALATYAKDHSTATEAIAALQPLAAQGVPSEESLRRQWIAAIPPAITVPEDSSLLEKINAHLTGLVSIKKQSDNDPYASLRNQATTANLSELKAAVEALPESSRAPFADWLAQLSARENARAALNQLVP